MSNKTFLQKLTDLYFINFLKIENFDEKGYRNKNYRLIDASSQKFNFIIYKNEPNIIRTIQNANKVSSELSVMSFPVRVPIKTINNSEIITFTIHNAQRYGCLYNYMEGNTIPWEGWSMKHLKLLGEFMGAMHMGAVHTGAMHKELRNSVKSKLEEHLKSLPNISDIVEFQNNRMQDYFLNESVVNAMQNKLDLKLNYRILVKLEGFLKEFRQRNNTENNTVLHMDLVRGNILFDVAESAPSEIKNISPQFRIGKLYVSGVIDFEKVAFGAAIFDIARTYAFLLVDCKYKSQEDIFKYFIKKGYAKRNSLKVSKIKDLKVLTLYFLLYDFYKFLLHNPYESLKYNEHFQRTEELLIQAKFLQRSDAN